MEHSLEKIPSLKSSKSGSTNSSKSASLHSRKSLDIKQATKGQFVVKPQDYDKSKVDDPSCEEDEHPNKNLLKFEHKESSSSIRGSASRNSVGHYSLGAQRYAET